MSDPFEFDSTAPVVTEVRTRPGDSWRPVDLAAVLASDYEKPRPTIGKVNGSDVAMFYPARINAIFGDSGGGKTWYALYVMSEQMREGRDVILVDYEDSPDSAVARLEQIGVSQRDILRHLIYIQPTEKWTPVAERVLDEALAGRDVAIVTLDSTGEALAVDGVSPNADEEVARWFRGAARYFSKNIGAAVILLDHTTKSRENGRSTDFAIGSQRKRAAINGAAYHLEVVTAPSKCSDGRFKLFTRKCRFGWRKHGAVACEVVMENHGDSDEVRFVVSQPSETSTPTGKLRPTWYMARVSEFLQEADAPLSKSAIAKAVGRKAPMVAVAIEQLIEEGFCSASDGPRNARLISFVKLYEESQDKDANPF